MVFRNNLGQAQIANSADELASFVQNFGWAPLRYSCRARPLSRESRRWKSILDAVAVKANGNNLTRQGLARTFLTELSGANSGCLVLGGMLADLSSEHYT